MFKNFVIVIVLFLGCPAYAYAQIYQCKWQWEKEKDKKFEPTYLHDLELRLGGTLLTVERTPQVLKLGDNEFVFKGQSNLKNGTVRNVYNRSINGKIWIAVFADIPDGQSLIALIDSVTQTTTAGSCVRKQ